MKKMMELRDMLCEELDKLTSKGQVTSGSLELIEKLTASIHYIDEIMQMEEGGYSNDGYSNARGRYAKRDSMGRYSSDNDYSGRMSYDYANDGYSREGYSRDGGYSRDSKHMVNQLRSMMQGVSDEKTRQAMERCISQIED